MIEDKYLIEFHPHLTLILLYNFRYFFSFNGEFVINENKLIHAIYPNPINEKSLIYLTKHAKNVTIEICDINGRIIDRKSNIKSNEIPLKELFTLKHKGIYILRININGEVKENSLFIHMILFVKLFI